MLYINSLTLVFSNPYTVGLIIVHTNFNESNGNMSEDDLGNFPCIPTSLEKYTHPKGPQQIVNANIIINICFSRYCFQNG